MKRYMLSAIVAVSIALNNCDRNEIFNPSEMLKNVPVMDLIFDPEDYTRLLSNKTNSLKVPVKIYFKNRTVIGEIRATGGGSRYDPRWSYRVIIQNGDALDDLTEFTLSAQVNDPTLIHTTVVSRLYKKIGFPVFDSQHIFLRINNTDAGLFVMIEVIKEPFFKRRNLQVNELYKVGFGSDFYLQESNDLFFSIEKEIPSDENYYTLLQFVEILNKSPAEEIGSELSPYLNTENYISYHALTSLINNVDAFRNNFYIWHETPIAPLKIIPWDFDRSFERSNDVGLSGRNAIIERLLENPELFMTYKNHLTLYLDEVFTPEEIFPVIDSVAVLIEEAYALDPYLGNGRYDFEAEVNELKSYIQDRRDFFEGNLPSFSFKKK